MPRTPRQTAALLAAILFALGFSLHLAAAVMLWRAYAAYGGCLCRDCREFYFGVDPDAFRHPAEGPSWSAFELPHDNILGQPVYTFAFVGNMILVPAAASAAAWIGIAALTPLWNLRRPAKERAGRCAGCGYDITTIRDTTCPECGADCTAQLTAYRADEAIDRLRRRVLPPTDEPDATPTRCITCDAPIPPNAHRCAVCSSRYRESHPTHHPPKPTDSPTTTRHPP